MRRFLSSFSRRFGSTSRAKGANQRTRVCQLARLEERWLLMAGQPDPTFGGDGEVAEVFGYVSGGSDSAAAIVQQPEGRIVVAGSADRSSGAGDVDFGVMRFNFDGTLDTTFSADGKTAIAFDDGGTLVDYARGVAIQLDGKIVLVGAAEQGSGHFDFGICRLNSNGSLDGSFGTSGRVRVGWGTGRDIAEAVAIQPDGKIVVAGDNQVGTGADHDFMVVRLNANGSLDTTFSGDGITTVAFDQGGTNADVAKDVVIQPDGKIVVAGYSQRADGNYDAGVIRLNSNGSLDTTFSTDGKRTVSLIGGFLGTAVDLAPDNKIVVGGYAGSLGSSDFGLARLHPNGSWDFSFGLFGQVHGFDIGGTNNDMLRALRVQRDGKIVAAGTVETSSTSSDFGVIRVNVDGSLDNTFDYDGKRRISFSETGGGVDDDANAMAIQNDGSILVAGAEELTAGGDHVAVARLQGDLRITVVGADLGHESLVRVYNAVTGDFINQFLAYPSGIYCGVRVAVGDYNSDGYPDVFTAPGPGMAPDLRVFDMNGVCLASVFGYDPYYVGGVSIAAADVSGDGQLDFVTGPGPNLPPDVRVFDGNNGSLLRAFFAYVPSFYGGVRVSTGDFNHDGVGDIVTVPGPGHAPDVRVYDLNGICLKSVFSYAPSYVAGSHIATGDVNGDGQTDFIAGPGSGLPPDVRVYSGVNGSLIKSSLAYVGSFYGGVRVAGTDVNGDGYAEVIAGPAPGLTGNLRVFDGRTNVLIQNFVAQSSSAGIFVASHGADGSGLIGGSPLRVAGPAVVPPDDLLPLAPRELTPVVTEAIGSWESAGLAASGVDYLGQIEVQTANLAGDLLGLWWQGTILIDVDAAGYGWYAETAASHQPVPEGLAESGRVDLLTVVAHEMGHALGLPDLDPAQGADRLMTALLPPQQRRLPTWREVEEVFAEEGQLEALFEPEALAIPGKPVSKII